MAFVTIGRDTVIRTSLGGAVDGATITYATAVVQTAQTKSCEINPGTDLAVHAAFGDGIPKKRPKRVDFRATLKLQILDSGAQFTSKEGYALKLEIKEASSLGSYKAYAGVITSASIALEDDENIETVEIEGGIPGHTYSGVYA